MIEDHLSLPAKGGSVYLPTAWPLADKFLDLWKDADEDLPEPHDARARLERLKVGGPP